MTGTELAFNIAGWGFTIALATYGGVILWLHTWMRTLERNEAEDENEDDFMRAPSEAARKHLDDWRKK